MNYIHEKHYEKFIHIPPYMDMRAGVTDIVGLKRTFMFFRNDTSKNTATVVNPEDGHTMTMPIIK